MIKYFIITGRVQGVCFRRYTQKMARELGLTGWVRNNTQTGAVEVLACGQESQIYKLDRWLHKGPATARVDSVIVEKFEDKGAESPQSFESFEIR